MKISGRVPRPAPDWRTSGSDGSESCVMWSAMPASPERGLPRNITCAELLVEHHDVPADSSARAHPPRHRTTNRGCRSPRRHPSGRRWQRGANSAANRSGSMKRSLDRAHIVAQQHDQIGRGAVDLIHHLHHARLRATWPSRRACRSDTRGPRRQPTERRGANEAARASTYEPPGRLGSMNNDHSTSSCQRAPATTRRGQRRLPLISVVRRGYSRSPRGGAGGSLFFAGWRAAAIKECGPERRV